MMDAGSNTKELKELYYKLDEALQDYIDVHERPDDDMLFDNYLTYDFMIFTNRELGSDDERITDIGKALYNCYDIYTVEEAREFYDSFKRILRIR